MAVMRFYRPLHELAAMVARGEIAAVPSVLDYRQFGAAALEQLLAGALVEL